MEATVTRAAMTKAEAACRLTLLFYSDYWTGDRHAEWTRLMAIVYAGTQVPSSAVTTRALCDAVRFAIGEGERCGS